ncbi:hypothetical protein ACFLSQ_10535 [Bacteroidota bacterium]
MKRIIIIIIAVLISVNAQSEEKYYFHKFTYGQFVSWMQSVRIPNFELSQTETEGSEETYNIEYSAMFSNSRYEMLNIRIGHPDLFYGYEELKGYEIVGPYDLEGFPAVFVYNKQITKPKNMTYMLVHLTKLEATFSVTAMTEKRLNQEDFEKIFRQFKLQAVENNEITPWPDEIPIDFRLPGKMTKITKGSSEQEMVKSEYIVKIEKSDMFLEELKKFYEEKRGWLDLTTFMDITLICKTTDDFKVLEKMGDGEIIEFVYYIK